jgi:hypothetical protein
VLITKTEITDRGEFHGGLNGAKTGFLTLTDREKLGKEKWE